MDIEIQAYVHAFGEQIGQQMAQLDAKVDERKDRVYTILEGTYALITEIKERRAYIEEIMTEEEKRMKLLGRDAFNTRTFEVIRDYTEVVNVFRERFKAGLEEVEKEFLAHKEDYGEFQSIIGPEDANRVKPMFGFLKQHFWSFVSSYGLASKTLKFGMEILDNEYRQNRALELPMQIAENRLDEEFPEPQGEA